jgi:hypothetical protein
MSNSIDPNQVVWDDQASPPIDPGKVVWDQPEATETMSGAGAGPAVEPEREPSFFRDVVGGTIRDVAGVVQKVKAGAVKGITLGVVNPEEGTVGIPFTNIKAKYAPPLGQTLQEGGVSKDIAENPYIGMGPELIGTAGPWTAITKGVSTGINTLRGATNAARGLGEVGSQYGLTLAQKAAGIAERVGTQAVAGGVVGGAQVRNPEESLISNALTGAAFGSGMQLAGEGVAVLAKATGLTRSAAYQNLHEDLSNLFFKNNKVNLTRVEAESLAEQAINAEAAKAGLTKETGWWDFTSRLRKVRKDVNQAAKQSESVKPAQEPPAAPQSGQALEGELIPPEAPGFPQRPAQPQAAPNFELIGKPYSTDIKLNPKDVIWDRPLLPAPSMTPPPASGAPGAALPSPGPTPMAGGEPPPLAPSQPLRTEPDTSPTGTDVIPNPGEYPVSRIPVDQIQANPKELQFKLDVNASGEQKPLSGQWNDLASGNLLLWQDKGGTLYVANGHHRLALAKRTGQKEVNAQVLREADGISINDARGIAAESNILEGKGTIYDQAEYFRTQPEYTAEVARKRGIETKGYAVGKLATANTYDLFRDRKITPQAATEISTAAPGNESLQAVGIKFALAHPKADPGEVTHFIKAIELQRAPQAKGEQVDLFGFDDAAIRSAEQAAKSATKIIKDLREDLNAISGASRRPDRAKKLGVDVTDPKSVATRAEQLKAEIESWNKWYNDPEKIAKVEGREFSGTVAEPRWEFGKPIPFGAVEVVQPGDIKRQKPDKTAQGSLFGAGDPYKEATEKHRVQFEKFNKTRGDYRSRRIGDEEFLAAKKEFDAAQQEFDKAEALEKKRPANPEKKGPTVEQLGLFKEGQKKFRPDLTPPVVRGDNPPMTKLPGTGDIAPQKTQEPGGIRLKIVRFKNLFITGQ